MDQWVLSEKMTLSVGWASILDGDQMDGVLGALKRTSCPCLAIIGPCTFGFMKLFRFGLASM